MEFDALDRKILALLQANGRITNAELAERIHLSPSACLRRVQRLEASGVISDYVALLDQRAVGRPTTVFVEVSLSSQSEEVLDRFEAAVRDCADVLECHLMSGDADYLLRVAVGGADTYENFHRESLSRFPGVARIRSNFALRTIVKSTALPV